MKDKTTLEYVKSVHQIQPIEVTIAKYDHWNEYEEAMNTVEYKGPQLAAEAFGKLGLSKNSVILEVGAGTGLLGKELRRKSYQNLVALEPSDNFNKSKASAIYASHIKDYVKKGHILDIPENKFDAAIMSCLMVPGHMHVEDLIELIPLMKKGGLICWAAMSNDYYADVDSRYTSNVWQEVLQGFVNEGLVRMNREPVTLVDYYQGLDGLFHVLEVV